MQVYLILFQDLLRFLRGKPTIAECVFASILKTLGGRSIREVIPSDFVSIQCPFVSFDVIELLEQQLILIEDFLVVQLSHDFLLAVILHEVWLIWSL